MKPISKKNLKVLQTLVAIDGLLYVEEGAYPPSWLIAEVLGVSQPTANRRVWETEKRKLIVRRVEQPRQLWFTEKGLEFLKTGGRS